MQHVPAGISYYSPSRNDFPFVPSTAPSARHITTPTNPVSYHGTDKQFRNAGTYDVPDWTYLPVALQSIGENFDFDLTTNDEYVVVEDYSGPGITDRNRDNEINYVSVDVEWDALDRWHDQDPNEHTAVLGETATNGFDNYIGDEARNAYIEGADGFTSRKLLDETLTRKYHARLLNVYLDKQHSVAIGSMRIRKTASGDLYAECVAGYCQKTSPVISPDITRENMELFIMALIRHGNNHAAKWFRERETFYKVHDFNCDLNCGGSDNPCNSNDPKPNLLTDEDTVQFLFEHQRYCSDSKCKCDERLAELVPMLAVAS